MFDCENKAKEVKEEIRKLLQMKKESIATAKGELKKAENDLKSAMKEAAQATKNTDMEAYNAAKEKEAKARNAVNMYTERLSQLETMQYVSEEESYKTIDDMLDYEVLLDAIYMNDARKIIKELEALHIEYIERITEAEATISSWTQNIRPNYRTPGTIYANGTNISDTPKPVHSIPYRGNELSQAVRVFMRSSCVEDLLE